MNTPHDNEHEICHGCGNEIDPDVCWCGILMKYHYTCSDHSPVPLGCDCGRCATPTSVMDRLLLKVSDLCDSQGTRDIKAVCEQLGSMVRRSLYVCAHKYTKDSPVGTRLVAIADLKAETERALKLFQPDS